MNILIGLVVVMFIVTGAYVGYHASQQPVEEAEGHDVTLELELFGEDSGSILALEYHELKKYSFS
jgi:hypothetical protein